MILLKGLVIDDEILNGDCGTVAYPRSSLGKEAAFFVNGLVHAL
jgi:hypothetical protein